MAPYFKSFARHPETIRVRTPHAVFATTEPTLNRLIEMTIKYYMDFMRIVEEDQGPYERIGVMNLQLFDDALLRLLPRVPKGR
jgi:hypothetical protein